MSWFGTLTCLDYYQQHWKISHFGILSCAWTISFTPSVEIQNTTGLTVVFTVFWCKWEIIIPLKLMYSYIYYSSDKTWRETIFTLWKLILQGFKYTKINLVSKKNYFWKRLPNTFLPTLLCWGKKCFWNLLIWGKIVGKIDPNRSVWICYPTGKGKEYKPWEFYYCCWFT